MVIRVFETFYFVSAVVAVILRVRRFVRIVYTYLNFVSTGVRLIFRKRATAAASLALGKTTASALARAVMRRRYGPIRHVFVFYYYTSSSCFFFRFYSFLFFTVRALVYTMLRCTAFGRWPRTGTYARPPVYCITAILHVRNVCTKYIDTYGRPPTPFLCHYLSPESVHSLAGPSTTRSSFSSRRPIRSSDSNTNGGRVRIT